MSSVALTIESLPGYAYIAHDAFGSLQRTKGAIEAHKAGNAQKLRSGVHSSLPIYLRSSPFAPKETIGPKLLQEGETLESQWEVITAKCLRQASAEKPDFTPAGEDPASYIISMISSEDPQKNRLAVDLYDQALTLSGRHPKALPVLERQAVYEKAVLSIIAPFYGEICPSKVESPYATGFYAKEPIDLDRAARLVHDFQHWTAVNLSRYEKKDAGGLYGGYGETFTLMRQDGYFASLAGPWLTKEARELKQEWQERKDNYLIEAIKKSSGNDCHENPDGVIDKWNPSAQDDVVRLASNMQLGDPRMVDHFQRQTGLGERLMSNLESRKKGEIFPNPQDLDQVKELVDISLEWTRITAATISAQDFLGWRGGFRWLYSWIERESAGQFIKPDLLEEGRKIGQSWQDVKEGNIRLAFRKVLGIDIENMDPNKALSALGKNSLTRGLSSDIAIRAAELLFFGKSVIGHLQKQALYEQKLLDSLKK
ncbi:MAG: hypothetical protein ABIH88_00220 [Patescibacteria group bacterium]